MHRILLLIVFLDQSFHTERQIQYAFQRLSSSYKKNSSKAARHRRIGRGWLSFDCPITRLVINSCYGCLLLEAKGQTPLHRNIVNIVTGSGSATNSREGGK
jgi:hypothetical protein